MGRYVLRRLLMLIPTLLGMSILIFLMLRLLPGDILDIIAGTEAEAARAIMEMSSRRAARPDGMVETPCFVIRISPALPLALRQACISLAFGGQTAKSAPSVAYGHAAPPRKIEESRRDAHGIRRANVSDRHGSERKRVWLFMSTYSSRVRT